QPGRACQRQLLPLRLDDRQLHLSGGPSHAHRVAFALAQKRAPERRLEADTPRTELLVQLVASDDLVRGLVAVLVLYRHGGAEERAIRRGARCRNTPLERLA